MTHAHPPAIDHGLFGPDSVTWRIHRDPSMLLAGLRALLLQATHPLVMAGFDAHSGYRDDPWGRLRRTGEWIATVTFADTETALAAGTRLRALHRRLGGGVEAGSGSAYRINDPALLTWVHVTEVDSFLSTFRRCGGSLTDEQADQYVDEMRRSGELVGLDPALLPCCVADIEAYYAQVRPQLRVTSIARRTALWGFAPPMPWWVSVATPARPAWVGLVGVAAGMLPPWARRLYGLPGVASTDLLATAGGRGLTAVMRRLPMRGPNARRAAELAA